MIKTIRYAFVASAISMHIACGGSGGSDGQVQSDEETVQPQLVLAFDVSPLDPDVFNIAATTESLEQDFNPGEQLRTSWFMTLRYDDGSPLAVGESHLYDASVFLSSDATIDAEDMELFSLECSLPSETAEHACGRFASFITEYSPGNQNIFSTTSIPLDRPLGLKDYEVDSTAFLDVIPKEANVIIEACLRDEPEVCDQFIIGVTLL